MNTCFLRINLLLLLLSTGTIQAQTLKERISNFRIQRAERLALVDKYQISGPLISYMSLQDEKMSPLIYQGPGAGVSLRVHRVSPKYLFQYSIAGIYNHLSGSESGGSAFRNPVFSTEFLLLRKMKGSGFSAGGSFSADYMIESFPKLSNDSYAENVRISLNIQGLWDKEFRLLKKDACFRTGLSFPVFSWAYVSPEYNLHVSDNFLTGPGNYQRFIYRAELIKMLKHSMENKVSLGYEWDIIRLKHPDNDDPLIAGNHRLILGFWLKSR